MKKSRFVDARFEIPGDVKLDDFQEFLTEALCEVATDLSNDTFGYPDVVADVGKLREVKDVTPDPDGGME